MKSDPLKNLSPLQRAYLLLERVQAKLDAMERERTEPIAILGMACRMPRNASTPAAFWRSLCQGDCQVGEVPQERWRIDDYWDPDPKTGGKIYSRFGNFLNDVRGFDCDFFGISPREAISLDPQHRMLLETSWEALEAAGIAPPDLYASPTGVYIGISSFDYSHRLVCRGLDQIDAYVGSGNCHSAASGRLSYFFGFQGPSVAIDTACSSSLVAVHLACQSLRSGECKLALAGGVNAILDPVLSINFAKARMLSADGRCKSFDAAADGYSRGEGAGIVVLKRLCDALADGDPVLAVIRGSAVNQDGPSAGLTVPNGPAQEAVIRRALEAGHVEPADVSYIEAHGTGTQLGDPIELGALINIFGPNRDHPLFVGSVKTNIGHLEAAAGVAGLLKLVLMLEHRAIPPHLHFKSPNAMVPWHKMPLKVPTELTDWTAPSSMRIAGLSSFGFSGTNVHLVVEEFSAAVSADDPHQDGTAQVLPLSAKTPEALDDLCRRHAEALRASTGWKLSDAAYTLGAGRAHFPYRLAIISDTKSDAVHQLEAAANGNSAPRLFRDSTQVTQSPRIAFVFPGEGAQYAGMGRSLYENQKTFRDALDQCDQILKQHLHDSLISILYGPVEKSSLLAERHYAAPVLFSIEYALARMWQSWGVIPSVAVGDGVGEYVAACVAEIFDLEAALRLAVARGRALSSLPGGSEEVVALADQPSAPGLRPPVERSQSIDAFGGPSRVNQLKTCPSDFSQVAGGIAYSPPRFPVYSSQTSTGERMASSRYWCEHLTLTSAMATTLDHLQSQGYRVLLQVGPGPAGRQPHSDTIGGESDRQGECTWLNSLGAARDDRDAIRAAQAQLYASGFPLNWKRVFGDGSHVKLPLPTYAFQRGDFWVDVDIPDSKAGGAEHVHSLLGPPHSDNGQGLEFELPLSRDDLDYLWDHRIGNRPCLPASAYIELALSAAESVGGDAGRSPIEVRNLDLLKVLPLRDDESLAIRVTPAAAGASDYTFSLSVEQTGANRSNEPRALHATAKLSASGAAGCDSAALTELQPIEGDEVEPAELYQAFEARGVAYGPSFRAIRRLIVAQDAVYLEARLPETLRPTPQGYHIHPVLLDACLQGLGALAQKAAGLQGYLPVGVELVRWHADPGDEVRCFARLKVNGDASAREVLADVEVFSQNGQPVAYLTGLRLQQFARMSASASTAAGETSLPPVSGQTQFETLRDQPPDEQRDSLIKLLERHLVRVLRSDVSKSIDPHANLFEKGVDSLMSVEFVDAINQQLGLRLSPETLLIRPTLAELAKELSLSLAAGDLSPEAGPGADQERVTTTPWIAHYKPRPDPDIRLFCFHHLGGTAALFADWHNALPESIDVCPIQLPGRGDRAEEPAITSFEQLLQVLADELLDYLDRPFAFFGHSGGNLIAFELAHLVRQRFGLQPSHLFVGDLWAPQSIETRIFDLDQERAETFAQTVGQAANANGSESAIALETVTGKLVQSDLKLFSTYDYKPVAPLECGITAFLSRDDELVKRDDILEWSCHTEGSFRVELVAGTHSSYLSAREQVLKVITNELMKINF